MADRSRRPFWIHQFAEYLIGLVLVSLIFQDPYPQVPATVGVIMLLNAASVRGPLGAFAAIGRGVHRRMDVLMVVICVGAAFQPWVRVTTMGKVALIGVLVPYISSWYYTDWDELPARRARRLERGSDRSAAIGKGAGRMVGNGWNKIKRAAGGDDS